MTSNRSWDWLHIIFWGMLNCCRFTHAVLTAVKRSGQVVRGEIKVAREQLTKVRGLSPESHDKNLVLTALCMPSSIDGAFGHSIFSGRLKVLPPKFVAEVPPGTSVRPIRTKQQPHKGQRGCHCERTFDESH